mmetsp:Transcript_714/g.1660  ORF Transcript_714/g.1660 Transcript_714/m.1660 type:complete len:204 (+) Transcript_714:4639-5250(+)
MLYNSFPVLSKVIVDVAILWLPNKHVRTKSSLRKTVVLRIYFLHSSTVRNLCLNNKCIRLLDNAVVFHQLSQSDHLLGGTRPLNLTQPLTSLSGVSCNRSSTANTNSCRNIIRYDISVQQNKVQWTFLLDSPRSFDCIILVVHCRQFDSSCNVFAHLSPGSTGHILKDAKLWLLLEQHLTRGEERLSTASHILNVNSFVGHEH